MTDDQTEEDNLYALAEWNMERKQKKLGRVIDKMARNLLSQMLHKDPLQRPTLARILAHPFLSGKKVARLVGDKPIYDVFLSYRVASDSQHVEKLYNLLTAQGFKVYWDKLCLLPGKTDPINKLSIPNTNPPTNTFTDYCRGGLGTRVLRGFGEQSGFCSVAIS